MLRCVKRSADNDVFSKKTPVILRSNREGRQRDKEVTNEINIIMVISARHYSWCLERLPNRNKSNGKNTADHHVNVEDVVDIIYVYRCTIA